MDVDTLILLGAMVKILEGQSNQLKLSMVGLLTPSNGF
jgi:hypothetical protein